MTAESVYLRVRNSLDCDDDNLAAVDRGEENARLMAFYPKRRFFLYTISIRDLVKGNPRHIEELAPEE